MTMKWLTILQFLEIVAAYGIVTLFLPWLVPVSYTHLTLPTKA